MAYVSVECPVCGHMNEADQALSYFFCLNCGVKSNLAHGYIYQPEKDIPIAPVTTTDEEAGKRLRRALLFLEDEDWSRAWSYCESVLDYDPENAEAYLVELLASMRLHSLEELGTCEKGYQSQPLFKKAMRFADEDLRFRLEEPQRRKENQTKYQRAKTYMESVGKRGGSTAMNQYLLREAASLFDSLGSFEDSEELAAKCRQLGA